LLAALQAQPGTTRDDLRMVSGLSGAVVAHTLRRLVEQGQLEQRALPTAA
jgi:hypothetical protein